jgi:hypothetical protein
MALVAAELSVAAQDGLGLSVALDKRFWELIRSHPDLTINGEVAGIMTKSNSSIGRCGSRWVVESVEPLIDGAM